MGEFNKRSFVLAACLMSMFSFSVAAAAEDVASAERLARVMLPPAPAIGFDDPRSLSDFVRRSTKEKDVAVRALGLSSLGRADTNGERCLTRHEYNPYLAMLVDHLQPERRAFVLLDPKAQDLFAAGQGHAQRM